jgi:hypothetical protein
MPLPEAREQLVQRVKSVCQVPELPVDLAEELREVAWCLALHCERLNSHWCLIEEDFSQL